MGRKYAIRNQLALHFVTFTVVEWIDLFIRNEYRQIIIDSLYYCKQNKGLRIHAYCIMSSHVHLILSVTDGYKLSDTIRDFKRYTSVKLIELITENLRESRRAWLLWMFKKAGQNNSRNCNFQLWQQHNHPIELDNNVMMDQRLNYIHLNPVVAGFVNDPSAWIWSSCSDYEKDEVGKLELHIIQ